MRTNIEIDDKLMAKAMKASRLETKTKRAVVEEGLRLLVKSRAQERALGGLFGKGQFWEDYDYKAMRRDSPPIETPRVTSNAALRKLQSRRSFRGNAA
jgi:Arc/MetJ family transcription regulator